MTGSLNVTVELSTYQLFVLVAYAVKLKPLLNVTVARDGLVPFITLKLVNVAGDEKLL